MAGNGSTAQRPSILLVRSPLLGADLESAFLAVSQLKVVEPADLSVAFLDREKRTGVRGVVSVNHSPALALLCRESGLRYVSWTVDPLQRSRWELVPGADCTVLVHRKVLVAPLLAMGHPRVEWMPLAAPERRFDQIPEPLARGNASFVGSSLDDERRLFLAGLSGWGVAEAAPALVEFFRELSVQAQGDRGFHGFLRAPALVPSALTSHLEGRASREDIAECLDAGLAWVYRSLQVAWWAGCGVAIHGDAGWREVVGESWRGPLRNGQEMTSVYHRSALNVDVPRLHQREIATLRAFDVMASGGVLLVESGTELEELFRPGEEFLAWSHPDQRAEFLDRSLRDPQEAARIARAAKDAAWSHRLGLRVARILELLE